MKENNKCNEIKKELSENKQNNIIFKDIKQLIEQTKQNIAVSINSTLTLLYWNIGKQINDEVLKNSRADYGKEIVQALSAQLTEEYGKGYTKRNLENMIKFNKQFNDIQIVHSLSAKLTWTHFKTIIYIEDNLKRDFYIGMIKLDRWSTRTLKDRIDSQLYERTALSKKPDEL
ncbi:MAG: cytoplasmic protein, partial [Epsilonproteobacteria bacterium]